MEQLSAITLVIILFVFWCVVVKVRKIMMKLLDVAEKRVDKWKDELEKDQDI